MKARKIVYAPAFLVSIPLRRREELRGPDGLLTKLLTLFSPEGGPGWLLYLDYEVRKGRVRFVFAEGDRAEVERRLNQWQTVDSQRK